MCLSLLVRMLSSNVGVVNVGTSYGNKLCECGHCNEFLGVKSYKEHHKMYYNNGVWITDNQMVNRSMSSSPLELSDPPVCPL